MAKAKVKSVFFFANGTVAVCDANGHQTPESVQAHSWLAAFFAFVPTNMMEDNVEVTMPDGRTHMFSRVDIINGQFQY